MFLSLFLKILFINRVSNTKIFEYRSPRFSEIESYISSQTNLKSPKAYNYKVTITVINEDDSIKRKPKKGFTATLNFSEKTIDLVKKDKKTKKISYYE